MTKRNIVKGCARCGGNHKNVIVKKFRKPIFTGTYFWTHWWTCPKTKEPVIAREIESLDE